MPPLVSAKFHIAFEIPPPFNVLPSTPTLSEPAVFKCFLCPIYYKQGEWDAHEKAAHYFQCTACDKTFTSENELSDHMKSSHDVSSIPVPPDQILTSDSSFPDVTSSKSSSENPNFTPANSNPYGESKPSLKCDQCGFTANYNRIIKTHMMKNHPVPPADPSSCNICDYRTTDNACLTQHIVNVHMKNTPEICVTKLQSLHCDQCTFTALKETTLRDHVRAKHEVYSAESTSLQCELCPFTAPLKMDMKRHIAVTHARSQCDRCHFTSSSQFHLTLHKEQEHSQTQPIKDQLFPCSLCGMTFSQLHDLDSHIKRRHCPPQDEPSHQTPNHTLTMVLEEQIDMAQTFKELKASMDAQLSEIRKDQETFRDDIKQLVNNSIILHSSFNRFEKLQSSIDGQVQNISSFISTFSRAPAPTSEASAPPPVAAPPSVPIPARQSPSLAPTETTTGYSQTTADPPAYKYSMFDRSSPFSDHSSVSTNGGAAASSSAPHVFPKEKSSNLEEGAHHGQFPPSDQTHIISSRSTTQSSTSFSKTRLETSRRPRVLFIGDAIGHNVDVRHLEEATNSLIDKERAFLTKYDQDSFNPDENFLYASLNAPSKRDYNYAVLQGLSADITNLGITTGDPPNLEILKQEVYVASQNMISAARNIILKNPGIEKVLILDCPPRFDPESVDPAQLKPKLAKYGNKILIDELEKCDVKAKISIGHHTLPKKLQQNIDGHPARKGYDVHLFGPDGRNFYTRSV